VVEIADDQGQHRGGFGVDHLLMGGLHLAPGGGLLERRAGTGTVAHIGHRDLHGILVHGHLGAQQIGAHHGVLGEIFGHAATDHEQPGGGRLHLDAGQLVKIAHRIDGEVGRVAAFMLVQDQAETGAGVAEGRAEDGHPVLMGQGRQGLLFFGLILEIASHLGDELAGGVGPRIAGIGNGFGDRVALLQFIFVDEGVVDAVDVQAAQQDIVAVGCSPVVAKAQGPRRNPCPPRRRPWPRLHPPDCI